MNGLSYNDYYEDSDVFVVGKMSDVGLTRCNGKNCYVSCGCNTSKGWYLAPSGGKDSSKTSARSYDYVIGDDGELASTGKTLSGASKTLSSEGSSKTLAAGSTVKCYKEVCPDGYYQVDKPDETYFKVSTHVLRYGANCYKVTGCADGAYTNDNLPSSTYFKTSSKKDPKSDWECTIATGCQCNYGSIGSGDGDTRSGWKCKKVSCSDENSSWYASTGDYDHYNTHSSSYCNGNCYSGRHYSDYRWCESGYSLGSCGSCYVSTASHNAECMSCTRRTSSTKCNTCRYYTHEEACGSDYTTPPAGYHCDSYTPPCSNGNTYTCYNNCKKHEYFCSNTGGTYKYDSASDAAPHASSSSSATKTCSCKATTTGTCYAKGSHDYKCPSGYYDSKTGLTNPESSTQTKTCSKSGCSATTSGTCYKEGIKYYTIHIHKSFGAECPSGFAGAYNGINAGCRIDGQNCSTSSNMYTADNVKEGSTFSVSETACFSNNSGIRAQLSSCSGNGCRATADNGSNSYYLSATITKEEDITFTYTCQTGECGLNPPSSCNDLGYYGGYSCGNILSDYSNPVYNASGGACWQAKESMATYFGGTGSCANDCAGKGGDEAAICYKNCLGPGDYDSWYRCCTQCKGTGPS